MSKLSRSPERYTFQQEAYIQRCAEEGKTPREDYLNLYESFKQEDFKFEADESQHHNNLEYDLRTTDWILEKVRNSDAYAQNLYAAMCNMRWQKRDVLPILKDEYWSCSWRSSGGIIADMQEKGDYIDWYCSGMGGLNQEYEGNETNEEWAKRTGYVPEGVVTEEIANDLYKLGWIPSEWPEDNK